MLLLLSIVDKIISLLVLLIIVQAILSWIPEVRWRYRELTRWLDRITNPLMEPFRRLVPPHKTGGIDISPALAIVALEIIRRLLVSLILPR